MTTIALLNNVPRRQESGVLLTTPAEQQEIAKTQSGIQALISEANKFGIDLKARDLADYLIEARKINREKREAKIKERDANFKFSKSNAMLARTNANYLAASGTWVYGSDSYAKLRVYLARNPTKDVFKTDEFLLCATSESDGDRLAPIYTFGTPLCFTAGRRPKMYSYNGELLVNQYNGNSKSKFWEVFEKFSRSSSAIIGREDQYITEIKYQNRVISGVMTALQTPITARDLHKIPFSFSLFVYEESAI